MNDCPCCTDNKVIGARAWQRLCQPCGDHAFRLQACPHEDERPMARLEVTKTWGARTAA